MIDAKEKTALATSVGADERQSFQTSSANIIPTSDTEINHPDENSSDNLEEIYRQMRRMADPHYLHTVSMTELYQTSYKSRPPIIGGLLYGGAYILAGAPKIGKSFLVAQIAYHVSTGKKLWDFDVHQGTVLYLALEDEYLDPDEFEEKVNRFIFFATNGCGDYYCYRVLENGETDTSAIFIWEHECFEIRGVANDIADLITKYYNDEV